MTAAIPGFPPPPPPETANGFPDAEVPRGDWRLWLALDNDPTWMLANGVAFVEQLAATENARILIVAPSHVSVYEVAHFFLGRGDDPHFLAPRRELRWRNGSRAILLAQPAPEATRGLIANALWWLHEPGDSAADFAEVSLALRATPCRTLVTAQPKWGLLDFLPERLDPQMVWSAGPSCKEMPALNFMHELDRRRG